MSNKNNYIKSLQQEYTVFTNLQNLYDSIVCLCTETTEKDQPVDFSSDTDDGG